MTSLRQHDVEWSAAEQDEFLATIDESADRLDDLIANLLAMGRLEAGALVVDLVPTAVEEVVARALIGVPTELVELHVPAALPMALADPGLLERAVANLADNAVRHEPPGGRAGIDVAGVGDGRIRISVIDHGPGLAESTGNVFSHRSSASTTEALARGLGWRSPAGSPWRWTRRSPRRTPTAVASP